jgi:hypothetical protein
LEAAGVSLPQFGQVTGGQGSAARAAVLLMLLIRKFSARRIPRRDAAFASKHGMARLDAHRIGDGHRMGSRRMSRDEA